MADNTFDIGGIQFNDDSDVMGEAVKTLKQWNEAGFQGITMHKAWNEINGTTQVILRGTSVELDKFTKIFTQTAEGVAKSRYQLIKVSEEFLNLSGLMIRGITNEQAAQNIATANTQNHIDALARLKAIRNDSQVETDLQYDIKLGQASVLVATNTQQVADALARLKAIRNDSQIESLIQLDTKEAAAKAVVATNTQQVADALARLKAIRQDSQIETDIQQNKKFADTQDVVSRNTQRVTDSLRSLKEIRQNSQIETDIQQNQKFAASQDVVNRNTQQVSDSLRRLRDIRTNSQIETNIQNAQREAAVTLVAYNNNNNLARSIANLNRLRQEAAAIPVDDRFGGPGIRQRIFGGITNGLGGGGPPGGPPPGGFGGGFGEGANAAIQFGSLENIGQRLGVTLGSLATPAAVLGVIATGLERVGSALSDGMKAAMDFEPAMVRVGIATGNASENTIKLRDDVLNLSSSFGSDRMDEAKAAYTAITSGVVSAKDAVDALTEANKLSLTTGSSVEESMRAITVTIKAFGQSNLGAAESAGVMNKLAKDVGVSMSEMSQFMGRTGSNAKALGINFKEVAAFLELLKTKGLSGTEAFQGASQFFNLLLSKQEIFKLTGMTGDQLIATSGGLGGAFEVLRAKTNGSDTEFAKLIQSMRGVRGAMAESAQSVEQYKQILAGLSDAHGQFNKDAQEMQKNAEHEIATFTAQISNKFETWGHSLNKVLGELIAPSIPNIVNNSDGVIEKQLSYQSRLTEEVKETAQAELKYVSALEQAEHVRENELQHLPKDQFGNEQEILKRQISDARELRREQQAIAKEERIEKEQEQKELIRESLAEDKEERLEKERAQKDAISQALADNKEARSEQLRADKEAIQERHQKERDDLQDLHKRKLDDLKEIDTAFTESAKGRKEVEQDLFASHRDEASAQKDILKIRQQVADMNDTAKHASPKKALNDQLQLVQQAENFAKNKAESARGIGDLGGYKAEVKDLDAALQEEVQLRQKYASSNPASATKQRAEINAIQQFRIELRQQELKIDKDVRIRERQEKEADREYERNSKEQEHQLTLQIHNEERAYDEAWKKKEHLQAIADHKAEYEEQKKAREAERGEAAAARKAEFEAEQTARKAQFGETQAARKAEFQQGLDDKKTEVAARKEELDQEAKLADILKKKRVIREDLIKVEKTYEAENRSATDAERDRITKLVLEYEHLLAVQTKLIGQAPGLTDTRTDKQVINSLGVKPSELPKSVQAPEGTNANTSAKQIDSANSLSKKILDRRNYLLANMKTPEQAKALGDPGNIHEKAEIDQIASDRSDPGAANTFFPDSGYKRKMLELKAAGLGFKDGGLVPSLLSGTDSIPAMLTGGEFVVNQRATAANRQLLESLNSGDFIPRAGAFNSFQQSSSNTSSSSVSYGDFHITVMGKETSQQTAAEIGRALRREQRRGTLDLRN